MAIGVSFRDGDGFETREKMGYVCATVKFAVAGNIRIIGIIDAFVYVCLSQPEAQARMQSERTGSVRKDENVVDPTTQQPNKMAAAARDHS
jgi:hypothetical protein